MRFLDSRLGPTDHSANVYGGLGEGFTPEFDFKVDQRSAPAALRMAEPDSGLRVDSERVVLAFVERAGASPLATALPDFWSASVVVNRDFARQEIGFGAHLRVLPE